MSTFSQPTPTHGRAPSHSPPDVHYAPGLKLARFLAVFGIVLGVVELFLPQSVSRITGVPWLLLIQAFGIREIVNGIGVLVVSRPSGWMWGRVGGDALDLATLVYAFVASRGDWTVTAIVAVAGITVLDAVSASQLTAGKNLEG